MFRILTLALILAWLCGSVAAADELPPATPATPGPTDPANCTVTPHLLRELRQLAIDADQTGATPTPEPSPVSRAHLPAGEPADIDTIAAITTTVEQLMACINANDPLRFTALFSHAFLYSMVADLDTLLADTTELQTPVPLDEDEWIRLSEVTSARVLPDGRVGAVVIPAPPDNEPVFLIFVQEGDRWLIDGVIEIADDDPDA